MEALQLKCPNCGASVEFKPDAQRFICDFCGSDFTEAEINAANETERRAAAEQDNYFSGHTNLYLCESCGAEIVSDENTAATFCHYCHGAVVLKGRVSGALQPELIIPFKYTRDLAESHGVNSMSRFGYDYIFDILKKNINEKYCDTEKYYKK